MATLAIGDVHGQYDELASLLNTAKLKNNDTVIFLGDLLGRGPKSIEVIKLVLDLGDQVKVVLGNHDLHYLYIYYQDSKDDPKLTSILNHAVAADFSTWLRHQELAIAVNQKQTLLVHAGCFFTWDLATTLALASEVTTALQTPDYKNNLRGMYGDNGILWQDKLTGSQRLQTLVNIFTRSRCVNVDGSISWLYRGRPQEDIPPGTCPWFDYPLRKMKDITIVCGHWSSLGLFIRKDIVMLDTGCCFGGPLTGFWIEDKKLIFAK